MKMFIIFTIRLINEPTLAVYLNQS